jgi:hypothetical protein
VPYAHSWYIDHPDDMASLGAGDAKWLDQQGATYGCATEFLTVLDFGRPTRKFTGHASPLDDYATSLFGHNDAQHDDWRTFRQIEGLAEQYLDAWMGAATPCPRLHLVLGTSNFDECGKAVGACDVYTMGRAWDMVAHDVMDYIAGKGYDKQVSAVWVGDDLETSWDPWPTTLRFIEGVRDQERTYATHAHLVNFGDANVGACSEVTHTCGSPWTPQNVYDAAWGVGWALPLPETYTATSAQRWIDVASAQTAPDAMQFIGVMTECGEPDPLPTRRCHPQSGGLTGNGTCEWSPAIALNRLHASDTRHPLTYATNIQWAHPTDPPNTTPCD